MDEFRIDLGIIYEIHKVYDDTYILLPIKLIDGYCAHDFFYNEEVHKVLVKPEDVINGKLVISEVHSKEDLMALYDIDDENFIKEYFWLEVQEQILIVKVKDGQVVKRKVPLQILLDENVTDAYLSYQEKLCVILKTKDIESLFEIVDVELLKGELKKLINASHKEESSSIGEEEQVSKSSGDKIFSVNQRIDSTTISNMTGAKSQSLMRDISLSGLERYIKERVFGHDKEIQRIATTIIMNFTALPGEKNEAILLVGPTGTGKTETMKAIIEYLDIPLIEINSANLVPQGIKGMSIEDCLYSLIVSSGYDLEVAQRGLIFFDEFDKLGKSSSDNKAAVIPILLKFIEGNVFFVDKPSGDYNFNTSMLIKVFAGAFSDFVSPSKIVGFNSRSLENEELDTNIIVNSDYFGKELISRIPHIFAYHELTRELKKEVMLKSKLSEFIRKKQRYKRQFGVDLVADDSYVEEILNRLHAHDKSMRDLNNLIISSLSFAEHEMLINPHSYKKLILTRESVASPEKIKLI